jgi:tRNA nucleotidyltransferase (CCA-adding enzyme)
MCNIDTQESIITNKSLLSNISKERLRDEFVKIIMSDNPMTGLIISQKLELIEYIAPVLKEMFGVNQEKETHVYLERGIK